MKLCRECNRSELDTEFYARTVSLCKDCERKKNRAWKQANKERASIYHRQWKDQRYALVAKYKQKPCADCGGTFPDICMDFDHISNDKVDCISSLVRSGASLEALEAEMRKCELVCSNCHRIRTHARLLMKRAG